MTFLRRPLYPGARILTVRNAALIVACGAVWAINAVELARAVVPAVRYVP